MSDFLEQDEPIGRLLSNNSSPALRRTLGFMTFLYLAWIGAWMVDLALVQRTD